MTATMTAIKRYKSRDELRAERDSLDMNLVNRLVDVLFQSLRGHGLKMACIAVRAEHGDDHVLLEWVDHYLNRRIAQVSRHSMGRIPGTINYLLDPLPAAAAEQLEKLRAAR